MDKVNAHLSFDYRGQSYQMSAELNLSDYSSQIDDCDPDVPLAVLLDVPQLIAQAHGVDVWSYEFEIMQQSDIWYDNAQGLAAGCVRDGSFDLAAYRAAWQQQVDVTLSPVLDRLCALAGAGTAEVRQAIRQAWGQGYAAGRADADRAARMPESQ